MNVSVIICTYNRCRSLAAVLDGIAKSVMPETLDWEVLVVDNNSSDRTRQVVADATAQHPKRFRYICEPRMGKSHALNTGIRESRGEILAFVDDDVSVEPTWLQNLTVPLILGKCVGAGGQVMPQWSCPYPRWLRTESDLRPLALFNPSTGPGDLHEAPIGANMAYLRTMFSRYGGFRIDLGPSPNRETPRPNEDTEFGRRLMAAGERLFYVPSAVVFHPVPESRLQKKYFSAWWFDKGRADLREFGVPPGTMCLAGVPLIIFRRLAHWMTKWLLTRHPAQRFSHKLKVRWLAGQIVECRLQSTLARARAGAPK